MIQIYSNTRNKVNLFYKPGQLTVAVQVSLIEYWIYFRGTWYAKSGDPAAYYKTASHVTVEYTSKFHGEWIDEVGVVENTWARNAELVYYVFREGSTFGMTISTYILEVSNIGEVFVYLNIIFFLVDRDFIIISMHGHSKFFAP